MRIENEKRNWSGTSVLTKELKVLKSMESKAAQIHQILVDNGYEPTKDTYGEYYVLKDIMFLNVELKFPERYSILEDNSNGIDADDYMRSILKLLKEIVDKTSETWVLNIELIYGERIEGVWTPMKSTDKYYICRSSRKQWFEIQIQPVS